MNRTEGRGQQLARNTLIITIGRISTQFVNFLLLPLYTALLTTREYGSVDLVMTIVQLCYPVSSLMIDQAAFRFLLGCRTQQQKQKMITSAFVILCACSLLTVAILAAASRIVGLPEYGWIPMILMTTSFSGLFLGIARGLHRSGDYALGSFISSASTILFNVAFIAGLGWGVFGMLSATFLGGLAGCVFLFFRLHLYRFLDIRAFSRHAARQQLRYSVPLVPHQLSLWIMNSSDRFVVSCFLGMSANGILAVSHKFPTIFMTFFNIFLLAWHETGAMHFFDEDRDAFFTRMVNRIFMLFAILCMCVMTALPLVFPLLVNSSYGQAYDNIPIYMTASLCNVMVGLLGVVYVAEKKTTEIARTTMLSAAINLVVHLALVRPLGLYAASLSTLAGYGVTMVWRIIDTRRYLSIRYDRKRLAATAAALGLCISIYLLRSPVISLIFVPFFLILVWRIHGGMITDILRLGQQWLSERKASC